MLDDFIERNLYNMYGDIATYCDSHIGIVGNLCYITQSESQWPNIVFSDKNVVQKQDVSLLADEICNKNIPRAFIINANKINTEIEHQLSEERFMKAGVWINMFRKCTEKIEIQIPESITISEVNPDDEVNIHNWLSIVSPALFSNKTLDSNIFKKGIGKGFLKILLAKENENPIATTLLYLDEDIVGIYMVATVPEYRKQGFGKAIMQKAMNMIIELHYPLIVLQSTIEGLPLYQKLGFESSSQLNIYYCTKKKNEMISKEQIFPELISICRNVFHDPDLMITETTSAKDVENWDSMTNLFLIDAIESHFNIKLSLDEILEAQNIGSLCNVILGKILTQ